MIRIIFYLLFYLFVSQSILAASIKIFAEEHSLQICSKRRSQLLKEVVRERIFLFSENVFLHDEADSPEVKKRKQERKKMLFGERYGDAVIGIDNFEASIVVYALVETLEAKTAMLNYTRTFSLEAWTTARDSLERSIGYLMQFDRNIVDRASFKSLQAIMKKREHLHFEQGHLRVKKKFFFFFFEPLVEELWGSIYFQADRISRENEMPRVSDFSLAEYRMISRFFTLFPEHALSELPLVWEMDLLKMSVVWRNHLMFNLFRKFLINLHDNGNDRDIVVVMGAAHAIHFKFLIESSDISDLFETPVLIDFSCIVEGPED